MASDQFLSDINAIINAPTEAQRNLAFQRLGTDLDSLADRLSRATLSGSSGGRGSGGTIIVGPGSGPGESPGEVARPESFEITPGEDGIGLNHLISVGEDGLARLAYAGTATPLTADAVVVGQVTRAGIRRLVCRTVGDNLKVRITPSGTPSWGPRLYLSITPGYATGNPSEAGKSVSQDVGLFQGLASNSLGQVQDGVALFSCTLSRQANA